MKAAYLVKYGDAKSAFQILEIDPPTPGPGQVLIKVEAFGINFADVMARLGLYKGAPPLPSLLGYDVVGSVEQCGSLVDQFSIGDRVTALTRFGGYAEFALADKSVVYKVPTSFSPGIATALATQYSTAYFLSHDMANLSEGDHVLIHAAAGGVGTALTQLAKLKKCNIYGTCSSSAKMEYLAANGVNYPINYLKEDFGEAINGITMGKGLDVIFDPVGGKSVKKGFQLLKSGGRLISYGVSSLNETNSIFGKIQILAQFGLYHPLQLLSQSKGIIGVNMLKIGDENSFKVARAMQKVIDLTENGLLLPFVGGEFPINKLAEAHDYLASRKSMGKIVVKW